jgi:hypothetical protein
MGSSNSSTQTTQQQTTAPGSMTAPTVQGLISQLNPLIANSGLTSAQSGAINQLTQNAEAGNSFAPGVTAATNNLLAGGGATSENPALASNLTGLQSELSPYTSPNYSTVDSPDVQRALQATNAGISNQVNSEFAAAGRSGSGANAGNLAYNEENADAPIILNQANQDTATKLAADQGLYSAGNTTAGQIAANNQTGVTNQEAGISAEPAALTAQNWGPTATIAAQELGQEIPATNLGLLANIGIPIAGLNMTSTGSGTSNTQNNPSLLQDITSLGALGAGLGSTGVGPTSVGGAALSGGTAGSGILGLLGAL